MGGVDATWLGDPIPPAAQVLEAAGHPAWLSALLARRGVATALDAERFLTPSLDQLHEPFGLAGLSAAVDRLMHAAERGERVAIVGDYDVDGVTSTALLLAVFTAFGIQAVAVLPHRMRDGYGFQPVHVERAIAEGCRLIVTADCGTSSIEAVAAARAAGLDVVITDHHLPGAELPAEAILVNPRQAGCTYPFRDLAAVGIAFKLAVGLATRWGKPLDPLPLLRIACLGTIADLVPLRGENRVIAALGLRALPETRSRGLRALIRQAGIKPPFSASDVGFRLGPRINAAGRLDSADRALELLMSRDETRAAALALELDTWNRKRQDEEAQVVLEATEQIERELLEKGALPPILLAWNPTWHRGVVGIAAGRIAKRFHRPTLLLAEEGESATGSGRSIPDLDLHGFLEPFRTRLLKFGGHSQAVGLSARVDELAALRADLEGAARDWPTELLTRVRRYEIELTPREIDEELMSRLERLEPFGQGNPQPVLKIGPLEPLGAPRIFGAGHLEIAARGEDGSRIRLVGWGFAERAAEVAERFEVLGSLERDDYRRDLVVRMIDCRSAAAHTMSAR